MNLTKGKINKIKRKKHQSRKRNKRNRHLVKKYNTRSFKKNKYINLKNQTLKRFGIYSGGVGENGGAGGVGENGGIDNSNDSTNAVNNNTDFLPVATVVIPDNNNNNTLNEQSSMHHSNTTKIINFPDNFTPNTTLSDFAKYFANVVLLELMSKFDVNTDMNFANLLKNLANNKATPSSSSSSQTQYQSLPLKTTGYNLDTLIDDINTNTKDVNSDIDNPTIAVTNPVAQSIKGTVATTPNNQDLYNPYGQYGNNFGTGSFGTGSSWFSRKNKKSNPENELLQEHIDELNNSKNKKEQELNNIAKEISKLKREVIINHTADKEEIQKNITKLTEEENLLKQEIQTIDEEISSSKENLKKNKQSKAWKKTKKMLSSAKNKVSTGISSAASALKGLAESGADKLGKVTGLGDKRDINEIKSHNISLTEKTLVDFDGETSFSHNLFNSSLIS